MGEAFADSPNHEAMEELEGTLPGSHEAAEPDPAPEEASPYAVTEEMIEDSIESGESYRQFEEALARSQGHQVDPYSEIE